MPLLLLCALVLLLGCAASQPASAPHPAPQHDLPVDENWVEVTRDVYVKRRGSWDGSPRLRHFWTQIHQPEIHQQKSHAVFEVIIDCQARTVVALTIGAFDTASGEQVSSYSAPAREFRGDTAKAVEPSTPFESAADFVCQPPEPRSRSSPSLPSES